MKKKILKGFIIILMCLLLFGTTTAIVTHKESNKIAEIQENIIDESEYIEDFESENEVENGDIVQEVEEKTTEENKKTEQTNDNIVSSDEGNKANVNTKAQPKVEIKQNSNSDADSKKTEKEVSNTTQVTTKKQEVAETTPVPTQKPTSVQTTPSTETKTKQETLKCTGNNHFMDVGNSGKWFNTEDEAIVLYNKIIKEWGQKWENFEIDDKTYKANCPYGYQDWSCICGKWTIDFYYR